MNTDSIALARALLDDVNRADWNAVRAAIAPDAVYVEHATQRRLVGREEVLEAFRAWRNWFPDLHGRVVDAVGGGERAILEIAWTGTHSGGAPGPCGGIAPSYRRVEVRSAHALRFSGGRLVEDAAYFDLLGLLDQVGALAA